MKKVSTCLTRAFIAVLLYGGFTVSPLRAQMRVGQPSGTPHGSAALDINGGPYPTGSPYRGIVPPKVSLQQTASPTPITDPAIGLLIYNTAKAGDVTPGYYYWEGTRWARFNTTSGKSARSAAAGDPLPAYTISEVLALPAGTTPDNLIIVDRGREGLFRYEPYATTITESDPQNGVILVTAGGAKYKRIFDGGVNVRWWGAVGDGVHDDAPAIQNAVNYAKSLSAGGGGTFRITVLLPEGWYRTAQAIDITNANGIILKGAGGRYINTGFIGCTPSMILDFTGSTMSGCENLTFSSILGYPTVSTIGVQFALSFNAQGQQGGGLNCSINNCYFQMADLPSANNGIGTIGILNCRSEEFSVTNCLIKAHVGIILTNRNNLSDVGYNYTVQSNYATVATGTGSMGVVNFSGQNSIQNIGVRQPALVLNGTNTVQFHGYLSRESGSGPDTTAAVVCSAQQTYNLTLNATVESFSQLLRIRGGFENGTINAVVANQLNPTTPVINATGALIKGSKIQVAFGNVSERSNRYLLYHAPIGNGDQPATGSIRNTDITCSELTDNRLAISANLLKNTDNTTFYTGQPFEKKAGVIRQLYSSSVSAGTIGTTTGAVVLRFKPADRTTTNFQNAGFYQIYIRGSVLVGNYGSGGTATRSFTGTISLSQAQNGGKGPAMPTVTLANQSTIDPNYQSINNVAVSLDTSDPNEYKVLVTPSVSGSGSGEGILVDATVEVKSTIFLVNDVLIYN